MKTREKILRCIIALIIIAGIVSALRFVCGKNKVKQYSTYCMDAVRVELGEYIGNIYHNEASCEEGVCEYKGGVSYEGDDYDFSCKVYNKENVELDLEPINQPEIEEIEPEEIESEEIELDEPEIDELEELLPEELDDPVAKMRVIEGETEKETQAMVEKTCANLGGELDEGTCVLEDGSEIYF